MVAIAPRSTFREDRASQIMLIGPSTAKEWLARNVQNRPVQRIWVSELAGAMRRGEWIENGESIKFSNQGALLDGQHRLEAVVQSGVSIWSSVDFGIPESAFSTLDRGKKRTLGDSLALMGKAQYSALAAATNWVWKLEHGIGTAEARTPSVAQAIAFLDEHPELSRSINCVHGASKKKVFASHGLAAALHYIFWKKAPLKADAFFELLADGTGMETDHPVFKLRERLMSERIRKAKVNPTEVAALTIRAWNAFVQNRPMRHLKGLVGDSPFPDVLGPTWTGEILLDESE